MRVLLLIFWFTGLSLLTLDVVAAGPATPDISIANTISSSVQAGASQILPMAVGWLGAFMALQFVLTNYALLKSGAELEAVFGKLIASLVWFGFCIYLLNEGPAFIESVGGRILNQFGAKIPSPGEIIASTLAIAALLIAAIAAVGTSIVGSGNSSLAMLLVYILLTVVAIGLYMAIKILMLQIELALIIALAPLSFSLLGLNALRDQGIAPLKSLIALVYRIILMGILCTAFTEVANIGYSTISSFAGAWSVEAFGKAVKAVLASLCAYPIIAFLVYKSDTIAATLAGGGSSLGTADVASAAAAGAAAGAAVGSMTGSGVGGFSKTPQSMSGVLSNMMRNSGSISNASSTGAGTGGPGKPSGLPAQSLGGGTSKPAQPAFPTNKAGAPQPRESATGGNSGAAGAAPPAQSAADAARAEAHGNQAIQEAAEQAQAHFAASDSQSAWPMGGSESPSTSPSTSAIGGHQATGGFKAGGQAAQGSSAGVGKAGPVAGSGSRAPGSGAPQAQSGRGNGSISAPLAGASTPSAAVTAGSTGGAPSPQPRTASKPSSSPVGMAPTRSGGASQGASPSGSTSTASTRSAAPVGAAPARAGTSSQGASSSAPMGSSPTRSGSDPQGPAPTAAPAGVANNAAIGGDRSAQLHDRLDKLTDTLMAQQQRKPGLKEHVANTNQHIAQERATTSAHINTHNSD